MRPKLIAGNWKLNGSRVQTWQLLKDIRAAEPAADHTEVLVCPPYVYLDTARQALGGGPIKLGAQDVSGEQRGAFTGEVSATMLSDVGCDYVIVGHSERRALFAEDDDLVAAKFRAAHSERIVPILCVGETLEEHEEGKTDEVVGRQLSTVLDAAGTACFARSVVAYEPVWAIGTGKTATPSHAQAVHKAIRAIVAERDAKIAISLRILYGGSVKPDNAAELFAERDVDGALVGGASLEAESFVGICKAAS